jgi:hypothetical protein
VGTWSQHLEEDRALVGHPRKDLGRRQRRFGRVEPTKVQQVQLTILVSYVDTCQAHHSEPARAMVPRQSMLSRFVPLPNVLQCLPVLGFGGCRRDVA